MANSLSGPGSAQELPCEVYGVCGLELTRGDDGVRGQEGCEVSLDSDGSHAGAASTVRDAEGLVQVQVAHVGADDARGRQANLG